MDPNTLDEKAKTCLELWCDEVLMMASMRGFMGGFRGMSGIGGNGNNGANEDNASTHGISQIVC